MERKRQADAFKLAAQVGPYDDLPLLPADIDPQVHLSRNDRPQPFFLVCQYDTILTQLAGEAVVEFKNASVLWYTMGPGDYVYVTAGTPHRIVPRSESLQVRWKAREPGLEAVAWYCERCGGEVHYEEWETAEELPQAAWWRTCQTFNGSAELRRCTACGTEHPTVDLDGLRWPAVAATIQDSLRATPTG